jgi:hypothetical protein
MSAVADVLQVMQHDAKKQGAEVGLRTAMPGPQGIVIEVEWQSDGAVGGRYYTDAEIAQIRADTLLQHFKKEGQKQ